MRHLVLLLSCLFSFPAFAERSEGLDSRLALGVRSRPFGAAVWGNAGYNWPVWGEWQKKENIFYGYVRPAAELGSSGTVTTTDVALAVYPISFFPFTFGRNLSWRLSDNSRAVDCWTVECGGRLQADYFRTELTVGAKGYFYQGKADVRQIESATEEDFYEDSSAVVGRSGYDRFFTQSHTIGRKFDDSGFEMLTSLLIGLSYNRTDARNSGNFSERTTAVMGHRYGDFRLLYAAGAYRSSLYPLAPTFAVVVEWINRDGLGL